VCDVPLVCSTVSSLTPPPRQPRPKRPARARKPSPFAREDHTEPRASLAAAACEPSVAQYRALFELSGALALVLDANGTIRHASAGWRRATAQLDAGLVNHKLWAFLHPHDGGNDAGNAPGEGTAWIAALDEAETRWRTSDGTYRPLVWRTSWDDELRLAYAVAHDAAETRRGPLGGDRPHAPQPRGGPVATEALPFSPRHEIETALAPLFLRAQEKRIVTRLVIAEGVPEMVLGDAVRLKQVLAKLVGNALKFTTLGSIAVRVAMDDREHIHVVVADTGIGISADDAATIFDAYRHDAGEHLGSPDGGSPIGLAACKELIGLMQGAIWLESVRGKGSAFHFTARTPRTWTAPAREVTRKALPEARRLRVLVAEDNDTSARLVTRMLERNNCHVVRAAGGRQAVDEASAHAFDLVFMDVQMPDMDGLEATRLIREHEAASRVHVPIWALTANAMPGDDLVCLTAGMDGHLAKPVDRDVLADLLARIRRLVRRR